MQKTQELILEKITNFDSIGDDKIEAELEKETDTHEKFNLGVRNYIIQIKSSMSSLEQNQKLKSNSTSSTNSSTKLSSDHLRIKLPELKLPTFSDNAADLFAYYRFKFAFLNLLSSVEEVSKCTKLVYSKSNLSERALTLIENLPITENNFDAAFQILDDQFIDEDLIINSTLTEMVQWPICKTLENNMQFITHLKSKLCELDNLNVSFNDNSSGNILLSNFVRSKLYQPF